MQHSKWLQILVLTITATTAIIGDAGDAEDSLDVASVELDPIVVIASKRPRPLSDVVGQVSVIDADFIERYLVENIDDLLRYEPGLNLESSGTRFGSSAINIRGIGGNRVAIEVDGIPVRDRFAIGSFSDSGRILSETDRVKRLEILYGPASTLYGSDALGGVMAITTWDPDDLLALGNGRNWYSLRGAYQSANDSFVGSGVAAWGNDNNGLLFAATLRDGHELDNKAVAGTPQDQQDRDSQDYFLRYTHDTKTGDRLRISLNDYQKDTKTSIDSLPGNGRFRRTTSLSGDDSDENRQLSIDYQFDSRWGNGVIRAFDVNSSTQQLTFEERAASSNPVLLQRYFQYDQDFSGLELNLFHDVSLASSDHHFGAGIELLRTDSSEIRDGFQQSLIDDLLLIDTVVLNFEEKISLTKSLKVKTRRLVRRFLPSLSDTPGNLAVKTSGKRNQPPAVFLQQFLVDSRFVVKSLQLGGRCQLTEVSVAFARFGEKNNVRKSLVVLGLFVGQTPGSHIALAADNRVDAGF